MYQIITITADNATIHQAGINPRKAGAQERYLNYRLRQLQQQGTIERIEQNPLGAGALPARVHLRYNTIRATVYSNQTGEEYRAALIEHGFDPTIEDGDESWYIAEIEADDSWAEEQAEMVVQAGGVVTKQEFDEIDHEGESVRRLATSYLLPSHLPRLQDKPMPSQDPDNDPAHTYYQAQQQLKKQERDEELGADHYEFDTTHGRAANE